MSAANLFPHLGKFITLMMGLFVFDDDDHDTCDDYDDPTVVLLQNFSNGSLHILISSVNICRYVDGEEVDNDQCGHYHVDF